jgi:8-oxo-dGTP diphosphatase
VVAVADGRALLIRRGRAPRLGEWSLPGGAQDLGETIEAAARREIMEEAGLELGPLLLLDVVDFIERDPDGRPRFHYTLVDFAGRVRDPARARAGDDAAELGWFDATAVERLSLWTETRRIVRLALERLG